MQHLEVEIQHWIKQVELKILNLEQACEFVSKALKKELSKKNANLNPGFTFFIKSGRPADLIKFIFDHLWDSPEKWPWGHLVLGLSEIWKEEKKELLFWLIQGAAENQQTIQLANLLEFSSDIPDFDDAKEKNREHKKSALLALKEDLVSQVLTFRSQQLRDAEKKLLTKLEKLFPHNEEVKSLLTEYKKRYADEILSKIQSKQKKNNKNESIKILSEEEKEWVELIKRAHLEVGFENPALKKDLIASALLMGVPDVAGQLADTLPSQEDLTWLTLEVMLQNRKFAEVLAALPAVEIEKAQDPETFFATAYLRAQALHGLGETNTAIEVLQGLISLRPHYRSAQALLNEWSQA